MTIGNKALIFKLFAPIGVGVNEEPTTRSKELAEVKINEFIFLIPDTHILLLDGILFNIILTDLSGLSSLPNLKHSETACGLWYGFTIRTRAGTGYIKFRV